MYLEKIHIKNYKVIEELEIDLKPGVTGGKESIKSGSFGKN